MDYTRKIRDLREDHDMTQAQVAIILNTTKNQIGKYERGEQDMNIKHLLTLCKFYNVSADYILGLPEGMPYGHSKTRKKEGI